MQARVEIGPFFTPIFFPTSFLNVKFIKD
jgi:hypothetical protein